MRHTIIHPLFVLALLCAVAPASVNAADAEAQLAERAAEVQAREAVRDRATAEAARAREELRDTQRELARVAARVAELSARIGREDLNRALREGVLTRPVFGLVLDPDQRDGVAISAVSPLGPAHEAGIRPGDRLLAVGDAALDAGSAEARVEQATRLLRDSDEGQTVELHVQRDAERLRIGVTPRQLPFVTAAAIAPELAGQLAEELQRASAPLPRFSVGALGPVTLCGGSQDCLAEAVLASGRWNGLRLFPLNAELGRYFGSDRGVLVLESGKDHPLRPGDVLLAVDGEQVATPTEVMRRLRSGSAETRALQLRRNGRTERLEIDALQLDWLPPLPALRAVPGAPLPPASPAPPASPEPAAAPPPARPAASLGVLQRALSR